MADTPCKMNLMIFFKLALEKTQPTIRRDKLCGTLLMKCSNQMLAVLFIFVKVIFWGNCIYIYIFCYMLIPQRISVHYEHLCLIIS